MNILTSGPAMCGVLLLAMPASRASLLFLAVLMLGAFAGWILGGRRRSRLPWAVAGLTTAALLALIFGKAMLAGADHARAAARGHNAWHGGEWSWSGKAWEPTAARQRMQEARYDADDLRAAAAEAEEQARSQAQVQAEAAMAQARIQAESAAERARADAARMRERAVGQGQALAQAGPPSLPARELDEQFPASIYPSQSAAVRGLSPQVLKSIEQATRDEEGHAPVEVKAYSKDNQRLLLTLIEALRREMPTSKMAVHDLGRAEDPPQPVEGEVVVYLWVDREAPEGGQRYAYYVHDGPAGRNGSGGDSSAEPKRPPTYNPPARDAMQAVHISVIDTAGRAVHSAAVADKPWADDFAAYVARHPNREWILVRSSGTAPSPDEAQADAVQIAAQKLVPYVRGRLGVHEASALARMQGQEADEWLAERILGELRTGRFIADRFTQRFDRPYGPIWQTSLLLEAEPSNVAGLAQALGNQIQFSHARLRIHQWGTAGSLAALVVLVLIVYALLNMATRGYFVWRLRAGAALLIAMAVVLAVVVWKAGGAARLPAENVRSHESSLRHEGPGVYYWEY